MISKEFDLKGQGKIALLTNETFKFDPRVKDGWFSAVYFLKTMEIIKQHRPKKIVTMQFFQKKDAVLCGVDEAIALLHTFAVDPQNLKIWALNDGDKIKPFETVLMIEGFYEDFGYLEGIIDGVLARRTSVATNVYNVVEAAGSKPIIFMGDRDDHFSQQAGDGYSAYIGGAAAQATHAMNEWWGKEGVGTMPHALIQLHDGDLIKACEAYLATYPQDNLVALVDYNNDVITDSLKVARHFGDRLYGVRVDTSANMVDQYFLRNQHEFGQEDLRGTNVCLIQRLREHLDAEGFERVKIIVSGGFDAAKIRQFEQRHAPVDSYGVGSSLLKVNIGFTGDCVRLEGKEQAKQGRHYRFNDRLSAVEFK